MKKYNKVVFAKVAATKGGSREEHEEWIYAY